MNAPAPVRPAPTPPHGTPHPGAAPTSTRNLSTRRAGILGSQLAELFRRPGRLVTTGMSVLVAAFVVFATVMAQQITFNTTLDRFRGTPEGTDLVVFADDKPLGTADLKRLRGLPGVADAAGRVETGAALAGPSERWLELRTDPGSGPQSRVRLVRGEYPDRAGEIAVNHRAAEELQLTPGSRAGLLIADPQNAEKQLKFTVTVTGVVSSNATAEQHSGAYTTEAGIAPFQGKPAFTRVDISAAAGEAEGAVAGRVEASLEAASPSARLRAADDVRADEEREAVSGDLAEVFQLLSVFLVVAVGAAALVATSAFRIVFAQRMRQLALLRAIGAPQNRLVAALAVEGALVGAVAGTLGVLGALAAGHLAPGAARVLTGEELSSPGFPVGYALLVVAGTVVVTVGSVLTPALSAARVSPLQALRAAGTVTAERQVRGLRLITGLVFAAAASGIALMLVRGLPEPGDQEYDRGLAMVATVASAGFAFMALIALGPLLVRPVLAVAGWPLRRLGTTGRLAVSGVGGTPRRAAAVSVVVALGVALVTGTLVAMTCLSGYLDRKAALEYPADFRVSAGEKGMAPGVVERLAKAPALANVTGYRTVTVEVGPDGARAEYDVSDLPLADLTHATAIDTVTGSLNALDRGGAVLSAAAADRLAVRAGDTLALTSREGTVRLTVAATLPGDGPAGSAVFVTPADLDRLGAGRNANSVLADASEDGLAARGAAHRTLERVLRDHVANPDDIGIDVLAESRDNDKNALGTAGTTALGLVGLTVLVAVVGVTATTSLTSIERTREFGLLRALGLNGNALRRTITVEAGLYGVLGGALGLALGIPYAWLLVRIMVAEAPMRLPVGQLLLVFTGLALLTALAGLLPARRATRISPMTALGSNE